MFQIGLQGEVLINEIQARKTNPNLNFWARIFSGGLGFFHTKGWGPKSSVCPSKPGKSNSFGGISLRAQRLKKIKILKFSSENENFKRAAHQTPIFCGVFWRSGLKFSSEIEIFKRDWKFQSRLSFFNLWALRDCRETIFASHLSRNYPHRGVNFERG